MPDPGLESNIYRVGARVTRNTWEHGKEVLYLLRPKPLRIGDTFEPDSDLADAQIVTWRLEASGPSCVKLTHIVIDPDEYHNGFSFDRKVFGGTINEHPEINRFVRYVPPTLAKEMRTGVLINPDRIYHAVLSDALKEAPSATIRKIADQLGVRTLMNAYRSLVPPKSLYERIADWATDDDRSISSPLLSFK